MKLGHLARFEVYVGQFAAALRFIDDLTISRSARGKF